MDDIFPGAMPYIECVGKSINHLICIWEQIYKGDIVCVEIYCSRKMGREEGTEGGGKKGSGREDQRRLGNKLKQARN